jgi:transcriptional regulator with XRE-family HTH domain
MTPTENESNQPVVSKEEIIQQISKALADRRAARGLSFDKVHQSLKIRIPYLEALEKGNWGQLPGDVYIKGFLKRYAQYLGFDQEKLLAPYMNLMKVQENRAVESRPMFKNSEFSRLHFIGLGIVIIFLLGLAKIMKQDHDESNKIVEKTKVAPPVEQVAPVDAPKENKLILQKHLLEVYSPLPLWLRVSSSDRTFEGFIPQASTWTWRGEGDFSVRFGHTQQISLWFDGKLIPIGENQKKIDLPNAN